MQLTTPTRLDRVVHQMIIQMATQALEQAAQTYLANLYANQDPDPENESEAQCAPRAMEHCHPCRKSADTREDREHILGRTLEKPQISRH